MFLSLFSLSSPVSSVSLLYVLVLSLCSSRVVAQGRTQIRSGSIHEKCCHHLKSSSERLMLAFLASLHILVGKHGFLVLDVSVTLEFLQAMYSSSKSESISSSLAYIYRCIWLSQVKLFWSSNKEEDGQQTRLLSSCVLLAARPGFLLAAGGVHHPVLDAGHKVQRRVIFPGCSCQLF